MLQTKIFSLESFDFLALLFPATSAQEVAVLDREAGGNGLRFGAEWVALAAAALIHLQIRSDRNTGIVEINLGLFCFPLTAK